MGPVLVLILAYHGWSLYNTILSAPSVYICYNSQYFIYIIDIYIIHLCNSKYIFTDLLSVKYRIVFLLQYSYVGIIKFINFF